MYNEDYDDTVRERKLEQLPVVLTPSEAMDVLGVGKNTMYRLLNSGELPAVRIGRNWRISINALQLFVS